MKLLFPLFPRIPHLSVVKCVVKKPLSEHPRDRGQEAFFSQSVGAPQAAIWHFGLAYCTSEGGFKQVFYAGIGGAEFASL